MKLELGKTYLTRGGKKVRITESIDYSIYKFSGKLLFSKSIFNYRENGRLFEDEESEFDIIQELNSENSRIQELSNSIQMLANQSRNPYLTGKEKKELIKSELTKLEALQSQINWRIMELNAELRVRQPIEEYEDL